MCPKFGFAYINPNEVFTLNKDCDSILPVAVGSTRNDTNQSLLKHELVPKDIKRHFSLQS